MANPLTVVYIPATENEEDVYVEAQLLDSIDNDYHVRLESGQQLRVPAKECLPAPVLGPEGQQDMIFLEHLNEGSLLQNLRKRFFRKHIYTYTGSILMSVNPYQRLTIYEPSIRRMYQNKALMDCPPHIFAIGDVCYRAMLSESVDQSVLVSGESGAGKTECCKSLMAYLSFISEQESLQNGGSGVVAASDDGIKPNEKVLATNPVLEAFGNAKTVRNDNSSRFGKMLDVQFDATGLLIGASIRQYLLEQIRVICHSPNERNFHCFYYVCAGADKTERERFSVSEAKDYYYTNQSGIYELPEVNSKYEYIELKRALGTAGISPPEIFNIMKLMSAILWLGNISFQNLGDEEKCRVLDASVLKWCALLLEVNPSTLTKALITRENVIRGETYVVPLSADKAVTRRDSLAKMLYQKNFEMIVDRLNQNIDAMDKAQHHCMLLDIFGFEVFENNYFEQFCINFANERLQFEFNEHIFRLEQQVYKSENIDISEFKYKDNKPCIHLIEKKPQGILWLLDEQAKFPQSTDKSFYEKICAVHKKRKNVFEQPRFSKNMIIIHHYAASVEYDTIGFLEKTKKSFGLQMLAMMKNSDQKSYAALFANEEADGGGKGKGKRSVGIEFRNALSKLMADLKQTEPHYVRCIKPNELKSSQHFNGVSVLRQLKCSGVLETIRIRSGGYPNRRPFKEFIQRYLVLAPDCDRKGGPRNVIDNMCKMLDIDKTQYRLGITKIFLKDQVFHRLEGERNKLFTRSATTIQTYYRAYSERMEFWIIKESAELLQYRLRQYLEAADPTEDVKRIMKTLEESDETKEIVDGVMELEKLGIREKNIDIIADLGGVKAIIAVSKKYNEDKDIQVACTRALSRFSNSEENVVRVARSGAVKQMVFNVNKTDYKKNDDAKDDDDDDDAAVDDANQPEDKHQRMDTLGVGMNDVSTVSGGSDDARDHNTESLQLIDRLATADRNVNIVIKERTVDVLTQALKFEAPKKNDRTSMTRKSVKLRKITDNNQHIAAKALGTITKHRKAALRIGRDEKAIETVLNSIRNKPQFGRMVTYSLNCVANLAVTNKHNWESIVELGGIDVALLALQNHIGNPSVIKEVGRLFGELCKNETYAQMIADSGALELALKYMKKNPDGCSVAAAKLVDDITRATPAKAKKILLATDIDYDADSKDDGDEDDEKKDDLLKQKDTGLSIICNSLDKMNARPDISAALARTINNLCDAGPQIIESLAHCGAAQYVLAALAKHPSLSTVKLHEDEVGVLNNRQQDNIYVFPIDCVQALMKFAKFDVTFLDSIKQDGVVRAIALAMDKNPELKEFIILGADALRLFAEQDDLRHAMDIIARSRMEADSFKPEMVEQAISIVGNLVLIDVNAQYVVSEGGIAIFLSIVSGKIKPATSNRKDAMVLASAVRALGRLLKTDDTVAMWDEEGGVHIFEDIVNNVPHSELVMNAICEAMKNILNTKTGSRMIKDHSQLLPLLMSKVFKPHSEYTVCVPKIYEILTMADCNFLGDNKLVDVLIENGLLEGVKNHLEKNKEDKKQVILSMNFINELLKKQPRLTKNMIDYCAPIIINAIRLHMKDKDALHAIYNCLYQFIQNDPNVILSFKEYGFEQVLAEVLNQDDVHLDQEVINETNSFLSTLISDDKITGALDAANNLAQKLMDSPNDVGIIEDLDKRLIFIANVCGAENKYKTVIDNGGLVLLPTCFQALNEAKDCLAREHAIKSCAFAAYKLGEFGNPSDIVEDGCYGQMAELYLSNVNYEGLADHLAKLTTFALKKPQLLPQLHEQNAIEANVAIIKNFPLRDDLSALAATNITKLAVDAETCQAIMENGGISAICEALNNIMINENTKESIAIFKALEKMITLAVVEDDDDDSKEQSVDLSQYINDEAIKVLVEAVKRREEPKLVEQALGTINLFCKLDPQFAARFLAMNGLNEVVKDLEYFKGKANICEPAMIITSACCQSCDAKDAETKDLLSKLDLVNTIKNNIKMAPNNEILLSSGVAIFASLAGFRDLYDDQLTDADTIGVIAAAVSARPRDILLTKALATFVSNMMITTSEEATPKLLDQLKQFGLIDILTTAASVHADNATLLPIIDNALNYVNPKAENILNGIVANIDNDALVLQSLNDTLQKLISNQDEEAVFEPQLLTDVLTQVWQHYGANNEEIAKVMMDITYELSEAPEYYGQLMQSGLVELVMKGTLVDLTDVKEESEAGELIKDLELGVLNVFNNLAMISDGKQYLNSIGIQEVIVKNTLTGIVMSGDEAKPFSDTDEQILLRGLRTIAALNEDQNKYNVHETLISNGLIQAIQQIIIKSDNQLLAKESFGILAEITTHSAGLLADNDFVDPQGINAFVAEYGKKFETNPTIAQFCNNIVGNLQPLISTAVIHQAPPDMDPQAMAMQQAQMQMPPPPMVQGQVAPQMMQGQAMPGPPAAPANLANMSISQQNFNANGPMVSGAVAAMPPPPPAPVMIDAQLQFQQALDRRLDDEQKEKAMLAFLDADLPENELSMLVENHAIDKLVSTLNASKKIPQQQRLMNALEKVTQKGDENYEHFVGAGGVAVMIKLINEYYEQNDNSNQGQMGQMGVLMQALQFVGEISTTNHHLKTVLGMHNVIQLLIKCIRQNPDKIDVLDSCMYVLANMAYDNLANMTQIIELGGVDDILTTMKTHEQDSTALMRSCVDLLSNLMHNSDQNRVLICNKGAKQILSLLTMHSGEDSKLAISCLRALGNLAYVPENIRKLVKMDIIKILINAMTSNLTHEDILQMGAAVLSNIAADPMISETMIENGVLGIILHVSQAFPDLIELQKSCLGCLGNIANNAQNCYTMIDQKCGKRILEILERIYFDDNVIKYALTLIKILTINAEIATQFTREGAAEIITRILKENQRTPDVIRLCSQALCKCIQTVEASEIAGTQGVVDALCDIAKLDNNCFNASVMIDIMKVFQNMCQIEINAQQIARHASIPILRGMEALKTNTIFLNVSATLVGNLAIYGSASKHIVKRGGCAVCLECVKYNSKSAGLLAKLLRCLANLVLTDAKSHDIFVQLQAVQIVQQLQQMYPTHKQIQKSANSFMKAMKLKDKIDNLHQDDTESKALKDKMEVKYVKFLTSGVMMKKFCSSAKPRKRVVKLTDDLEYILLVDPNGKKAPKKIYIRYVTELRTGACTYTLRRSGFGWKKAHDERCFAIFTLDPSGKTKDWNLECKTVEVYEKWTEALQQLIVYAHEKSKINKT